MPDELNDEIGRMETLRAELAAQFELVDRELARLREQRQSDRMTPTARRRRWRVISGKKTRNPP